MSFSPTAVILWAIRDTRHPAEAAHRLVRIIRPGSGPWRAPGPITAADIAWPEVEALAELIDQQALAVLAGVRTIIGPEYHDDPEWGDRRIRRPGGWGERLDSIEIPGDPARRFSEYRSTT